MAEGYEPSFEFYECSINDLPAYITVDMNLNPSAPQEARPVLADIRIALRQPKENGLPVKEESSRIYELEDLIESTLTGRCDCVLAGKIWNSGARNLYFYCAKADALGRALQGLAGSLQPYEPRITSFPDPDWSSYRESLYPNDLAMQHIADRKTVDTLVEQGDNPEIPRPVDHWAYFAAEAGRDAFVGEIRKQGFQVDDLEQSGDKPEPFRVRFSRVDPVRFGTFCRVTEKLSILASRHDGTYDGWECPVTKD